MSKKISQDTFDNVVKENIIDFELDADQAQQETIDQFKAQGVDLTNIITNFRYNGKTGRPILYEVIEQLCSFERNNSNDDDLVDLLSTLTSECQTSVAHRIFAAGADVQIPLHIIIETELDKENIRVLKSALIPWNELVFKYQDIFNPKSLYLIIQILEKKKNDDLILLVLQHLKYACVLHENNRQNIVNADILKYLKPLLQGYGDEIVKEVCCVFRNLILDDDLRSEFSKAHEHARIVAKEILVDLTKLLADKMDNQIVFSELLLTLAAIVVRQEFCKDIENAGGLQYIYDGMMQHEQSLRTQNNAMKLLRALTGDDGVKNNILHSDGHNFAKLLDEIINLHKANETFARSSLGCIATLTLRSPENSRKLFENGIAETIVETMKLHPSSSGVLTNGARAIRNMVSRSRDQCAEFLAFGVEDIIKAAMVKFPKNEYDLKSALRDLDCEVNFKEEWTGEKNKLNIDQ